MIRFDIETTPNDLVTKVRCSNIESIPYRSIKFSFSSLTTEINNSDDGFTLPWIAFREGLLGFVKVVRESNSTAVFSDFDSNLISEYLNDLEESKNKGSKSPYSDHKISKILKQNHFTRDLISEQIRNLKKLLSLKHGANFSVPGAGKTTTMLALHSILKHHGMVNCLFVVAPLNAFISWEDEVLEIFGEGVVSIKRLVMVDVRDGITNNSKSSDIYLINYEKLRGDVRKLYRFFLDNNVHFVLDESHRIKGGKKNLSYQQIIKLAELSKRRDIMSGTPMPQSYLDLDSQFRFLWRSDILPEAAGTDNSSSILSTLNNSLRDNFVRTTKKELGLKKPKVIYSSIDMGPIQAELYRLIKSEFARQLSGMDRESIGYYRDVGRCTVRLLQAATNPMLISSDDEYFDSPLEIPRGSQIWELLGEYAKYEKSSKIEYLKQRVGEILEKSNKNRVVIWSYFVRNIKLLERQFSHYGAVSIYGDIPVGDPDDDRYREARIRKFHNDPNCRILIANPQAAGEGISLHKASHFAIYLDRNFNAAYYLQSLDRIHRLGLSKDVTTTIEIIIAKETIDEVLVERLNKKIIAMGKVLDDPGLVELAYDPFDIQQEDRLGLDEVDMENVISHIIAANEE